MADLRLNHHQDLQSSGLSEETIQANGIFSAEAEEAKAILGFSAGPGLAFPYPYPYSENGNGKPFIRIKPDIAPVIDGKPAKYLSPRNSGNHLYFPKGVLEALQAEESLPLIITEGEKKALKALQEGFACIGLSGVWCFKITGEDELLPDFDNFSLQGRKVYICFDSDREEKRQIRLAEKSFGKLLQNKGASVFVIELPQGGEKKQGLDDFLITQGREAFLEVMEKAKTFDLVSAELSCLPPKNWPPVMDKAAFHGHAGEFVRMVSDHTESDPAGLLLQFLIAFGNLAGRKAHCLAEADKHFSNLFGVLVGKSSRGRKGTSWGHILRVLKSQEEVWASERIKSGLSSGEGLIFDLKDCEDGHIPDKRLLITETEFASVLRVLGREGNILSAILRNAWDSGHLNTLTKNNPVRATNAHVSIIGHITQDELLRYLDSTEAGNGFANRFLWCCVKRSKILPEGGNIHSLNFALLNESLKKALAFSNSAGEIKRDEEARSIWKEVYPVITEDRFGLFGALTARSDPQVMRLSLIYALLDSSPVIQAKHLMAALALWEYCENSVKYIFGDSLGDKTADAILQALRNNLEGLSRTEISGLFQRHKSSEHIDRALNRLESLKLIRRGEGKEEELGRPSQYWLAVE